MPKPELKTIPIECLKPGKYQTRRVFDQEALHELADSIKSEGLIQPIVVRAILNSKYEIVAGERRWRASQLAGVDMVLCLVNNYSDEQAAAITTIENIQRADLNPIEEAQAYQNLIEEFEYLHEEVAAVVGISREQVTNCLRLLKLDKRVQDLLISEELSRGHGKAIAGLSLNLQYEIAKKCAEEGWSSRRIEQEVKKLQTQNSVVSPGSDPDMRVLERLIGDQIGSTVKFEPDINKKSGWIKIKYFDNEILAGILDRLGIDYE